MQTPMADVPASPRWTAWGIDLSNTRFQPRGMAGLGAADLPRLKLKWAFGFPGSSHAWSQPPEVRQVGEVPSYALCGFTRLGQKALAQLARSDRNVARVVRNLRGRARSDALTYLLFEAEGGVCTQEVSDPLGDELERLALGCWTGLPRDAVPDAIDIMRAAIPALNDVRADMAKVTRWAS